MSYLVLIPFLLFLVTPTPPPTPPDFNRTLTPGTPVPPTPPDLDRTLTPGTPVPLTERVWMPVILK